MLMIMCVLIKKISYKKLRRWSSKIKLVF